MTKQTWFIEKDTIKCEIDKRGMFTWDLKKPVQLDREILYRYGVPVILMEGPLHTGFVILRGEGVDDVVQAIIEAKRERDGYYSANRVSNN